MPKITINLIFLGALFLVGCQGKSDPDLSSSGNEETDVICPSGSTFEIDGVELQTHLYDRDNNGCLSDTEYEAASIAANRILDQQAKEMIVDGVDSDSSISRIHSIKVIGSSEVSDNKVQLHSNIDSGDFHLSFETYTTNSIDQSLKVYFDDESALGKEGTSPEYAMTFPLPPLTGNISYALGCHYLVSVAVNCDTLLVTDTHNIGSNVMTLNIDVTFPLSLTFSAESLPLSGYIIATFCNESADDAVCLDNYAEIPVSFN